MPTWQYTYIDQTRSYARGYQLTDFGESHAGGVTVNTGGSYTYDTNNNMTGTKSLEVYRTGTSERLAYRPQWTFTYDRRNRLKSYTHSGMLGEVTHMWWDGAGRVWQRWDYNTLGKAWDIEADPKVCCEVLRQCKVCTDQRVRDELAMISSGLVSAIIAAYTPIGGCMCSYQRWEFSNPALAQQAAAYCRWRPWDLIEDTCQCTWWQSFATDYMVKFVGRPGGTRCWGYCNTDWQKYSWSLVGHSWVTIWADKFLRPVPVKAFDVWTWGHQFKTRSQHETLWPKTDILTFGNCRSGGGDLLAADFDPGY